MPRERRVQQVSVRREPILADVLDYQSRGLFERFFKDRVSSEIIDNLNPKMTLRDYQMEALGRFEYYLKDFPGLQKPVNLLFHLATGSGKTLLMAANILKLYRDGYRNFIFFVNSTSIVDKTRDNFLNPHSSKFLFNNSIQFEDRMVRVREVNNFDEATKDDINIIFSTVQGLHAKLNLPRENAVTFEDLKDRRIVLISDETHHLNALTKVRGSSQETLAIQEDILAGFDVAGLNREEEENLRSWEGTVRKILHQNKENVLLEYTATIDLLHPNIFEKYKDKIIYQYDLRKFRQDRYSKEIDVVQADFTDPLDRALRAVVVSQYKKKVATAHGLILKSVILFKANRVTLEGLRRVTSDDVGSREFQKRFEERLSSLSARDLREIRDTAAAVGENIIGHAFEFFKKRRISLESLADELRLDFARERLLSANDDEDLLKVKANSLEDEDNEIRAVFAVAKLTEGWDVLNLFDIVRLYNTRDARNNRPGKTTISEAQLIGRGARYFPFRIDPSQEKDRRKYDDDVDNDLRMLEMLHYHSAHNPDYISELKKALEDIGIDLTTTKLCSMRVKGSFKKTGLYKNGVVFVNERKKRDPKTIVGFDKKTFEKIFRYDLQSGEIKETEILGRGEVSSGGTDRIVESYLSSSFRDSVIRKAIDRVPFFTFANLRRYFPNLTSIQQFITDPAYLGSIKVDILGSRESVHNLSSEDQMRVFTHVLSELQGLIEKGWSEYFGTSEFKPVPLKSLATDKDLKIAIDEKTDQERGRKISEAIDELLRTDLRTNKWYIYDENYGTSMEKKFIRFIEAKMDLLSKRYSDIFLFRNEKEVKIFRFSDARATEPDFLLFMTDKNSGKKIHFQLFIEAKGENLVEQDQWKEDFLLTIEREGKVKLYQDKDFRIIGMPFFTNLTGHTPDFKEQFDERFLSLKSASRRRK